MLFRYDPEAVRRIKRVPGRRWDRGAGVWRIPDTEAARTRLRELFPPGDPDYALGGALAASDESGPPGGALAPPDGRPHPSGGAPASPDEAAPAVSGTASSPGEPLEALEALDREMVLRGRSPRTRKLYRGHLRRFLRWLAAPVDTINGERIRDYLVDLAEVQKVSRSYQNQAISALRFYCDHVLRRPQEVRDVPRPKKPKRLPRIISRNDVERMLAVTPNRKHRAMIMLLYGAGLRVGELVRLKPGDLDEDGMAVLVRRSKGEKDRMTVLSRRALEAVREYREWHRVDEWLFPSARDGRHITTRTVQKIVRRAGVRAGLERKVTPHVLRHTFATHLMEAGVGLRHIQELLGHASSRTTEIYTHVSRRDLARIRSPLDLPAEETNSK